MNIASLRRDEQQASEFKALCCMEADERSDGLVGSNSRAGGRFLRRIPSGNYLTSAEISSLKFAREIFS